MTDKVVGVLGGGQLGRMLAEPANRRGIKLVFLDVPGSPAKQVTAHDDHVDGSFKDAEAVRQLGDRCDVITAEIEHVNTEILEQLGLEDRVHPRPSTIRLIQDKYNQKCYYDRNKLPTAKSLPVLENAQVADIEDIAAKLRGFPFMLKARKDAYDGRGNYAVHSKEGIPAALEALKNRSLYAEQWVKFDLELAVMVVKTIAESTDWQAGTRSFPVVETVHQDSICKLTYCPPRERRGSILDQARILARKAVAELAGCGIFGVEMFLLSNNQILINEIAPRPHNSGHYTIDACRTSQFEAHLRSILGVPLSEREMVATGASVMLNVLGGASPESHLELVRKAAMIPNAYIHMYGKGGGRPGRKMGHITVVADSLEQAEADIEPLIECFDSIRCQVKDSKYNSSPQESQAGALMANKAVPLHKAKVVFTMGSQSDQKYLMDGFNLLVDVFGVPTHMTITSAHRTPTLMSKLAKTAASNGVKVIIAAAGGSAHLPGMLASETTLPVLGVPIKGPMSDGKAAIYSMIEMPPGCPLMTIGPNNSKNAALSAVRILALSDGNLRGRLAKYMQDQFDSVARNAEKLEALGPHEFMQQMQGR